MNNKEIDTCKSGKLLGLNIPSSGFVTHIRKTINKRNGILTNLKRFRNLTPKIKATLVKTLLIPGITYGSIPIVMALRTHKIKMQTILNKALRSIHCNEEEYINTAELHLKYNIAPINITNHHKALKTWEAINPCENDRYNRLVTDYTNTHSLFPKTSTTINMELPEPIIT